MSLFCNIDNSIVKLMVSITSAIFCELNPVIKIYSIIAKTATNINNSWQYKKRFDCRTGPHFCI